MMLFSFLESLLDSFDSTNEVCRAETSVVVSELAVVVVGVVVNDDRRHRRRVQDGVGQRHVIEHRRHSHLTM